jgi:hypothetical protein
MVYVEALLAQLHLQKRVKLAASTFDIRVKSNGMSVFVLFGRGLFACGMWKQRINVRHVSSDDVSIIYLVVPSASVGRGPRSSPSGLPSGEMASPLASTE